MGSWTGTVPTITGGTTADAADVAILAAIATALTDPWTTWSPTLTNLTLGNGTQTAKYVRLGKTVWFRWKFKLGSGSSVSGAPRFTLPVAASTDWGAGSADFDRIGDGRIWDTSATALRQADPYFVVAGGSTVELNYLNAGVPAAINATTPWTWTTGDTLAAWGTYYTD